MAEDTMDIVSEHGLGHDTGDDYMLEIDIEDDHMQFDGGLDADLGDATIQQSPQVGADDFMLDDENQESTYQSNDENMHEEEEHIMEDQSPSQSFIAVGDASLTTSEVEPNVTAVSEDYLDFSNDQGLVAGNSPEPVLPDETVVQSGIEEHQEPTLEGTYVQSEQSETGSPIPSVLNLHEALTSPQLVLNGHEAENHGNPLSLHQELPPNSPHDPQIQTGDDEVQQVADDEIVEADDFEVQHSNLSFGLQMLKIIYQNTEYSLFGSASDDPNSFFLTDVSIADKPISDFFRGIRDVIHGDITDEEELCVSVTHFGLDIEETVCSLHDVTINQLLELHEKLIENEEVVDFRPLRIYINTRPSFARRLANLAAGAAEGKKLYELVSEDEYNSQRGNSGEGTEVFEYPESHLGVEVEDGNINEGSEHVNNDNIGEDLEGNYDDEFETVEDNEQPAESHDEHATADNQASVDESTSSLNASEDVYHSIEQANDAVDGPVPNTNEPAAQDEGSLHKTKDMSVSSHDTRDGPEKQQYSALGLDEDGDLIDYSEDEQDTKETSAQEFAKTGIQDFIHFCILPLRCACPKCVIRITAELHEINEDMRRRSLSRAADSKATTPPMSDDPDQGKSEFDHNNDVDEFENWDQHVAQAGDLNHQGDSFEVAEDFDDDYLDLSGGDGGQDGHQHAADDSNFQSNIENQAFDGEGGVVENTLAEIEDEINYDLDDDPNNAHQGDIEEVSGKAENPINWSTPIPKEEGLTTEYFEPIETAGSSATLSIEDGHAEDSLDPEGNGIPKSGEDQTGDAADETKDEIDYDDDDYGEGFTTPSKSEPVVLSTITNGGSGKRPWQEPDDGSALSNSDAKRTRS